MTNLMACVQACHDAVARSACERFAEDFVCQVGPALRRFIDAHTRPDLADDAYQETLIAIATDVRDCRAETESQIWKWCYQVARNKMADQWRQTAGAETVSLDIAAVRRAVEASGGEERIRHEDREELEYAMGLLQAAKPPCVDYLWEAYGLALTYVEMGKLYGRSADTMRMKVNRCLALAQQLVRKKTKVNHD
jgi:RNA polymerase sigma factor (sigma-70 family)